MTASIAKRERGLVGCQIAGSACFVSGVVNQIEALADDQGFHGSTHSGLGRLGAPPKTRSIRRPAVCAFLVLFCFSFFSAIPVYGAPELTEADTQIIEDGVTVRGKRIGEEAGFFALLRNCQQWQVDDFSGQAGQAIAPTPDYDYLFENPGQVLGNVYLIEGVFEQQVRYPTGEKTLIRTDWGDRVTRWVIRTSDDPNDSIVVFFHDPEGKIIAPKPGAKVRVAARFYKVWLTESQTGEPFQFLTFVGGAREVVAPPGGGLGFQSGGASRSIVIALIVMCIAAFFVVRFLMNRKAAAGAGGRTQAYLEERRRERERQEQADGDEEDQDIDLPEDPAEAMRVLQERHNAQ